MTRIGIVDCGISNIGSVRNAFEFLGIESRAIHSQSEIAECSHLVLPGDGSFPVGMKRLQDRGLDYAICRAVEEGKPLLGICLGMQLLAEEGLEFEPTRGLALTCGRITRIEPSDPSLPVPQVGWSKVDFFRQTRLAAELHENPTFYFMQSYAFSDPSAPAVAGICDYGGPIVAVIEQGHVFGVQFHPEKSQRAGLGILKNFATLT